MQKVVSDIVRHIKRTTGTDLSVFDEDFLKQTLEKKMAEAGIHTLSDYRNELLHKPETVRGLQNAFFVNYSEFFRDPLIYALLWRWIFPLLFAKKAHSKEKEIRIWSAATASGQEAYTLAMLLTEIEIQNPQQGVSIQIFGSDICSSEIEKAREGFYPVEQLQKVPLKYINEYFYPVAGGYRLIPRIRESVKFFVYDLLHAQTTSPPESIFGSFDIIYCSNLLIYYNEEARQQILRKLFKNLVSHGVLITGDTEKAMISPSLFREMIPPAPIFQKTSDKENPIPPDGIGFVHGTKESLFRPI